MTSWRETDEQAQVDLELLDSRPATGLGETTAVRRTSSWPVLVLIATLLIFTGYAAKRGGTGPDAAVPTTPSTYVPAIVPEIAAEGESEFFERGSGIADDRVYVLSIPVGSSAWDPEMYLIDGDSEMTRLLGREMWSGVGSLSRLSPGEDRFPILTTSSGLVLVTLDGIVLQDRDLALPAEFLAEGIAVMEGPTTAQIWILGSSERTVELYDVENRQSLGMWNLTTLGRTVTSVQNGLLIGPTLAANRTSSLAWFPEKSPIILNESDGLVFMGAGGSVVVMASRDELFVYDLDLFVPQDDPATNPQPPLGVLDPLRLPIPAEHLRGSSVSPDGAVIALTVVTPLTEPNRILVTDLSTGERVSEIPEALEFQYRWSSPVTLLFMRPDWPQFALVEHDIETRIDRHLLSFADLHWWYAVDSQS